MEFQLQLAVNKLIDGEVIAYPTEAVWGLGCDPWKYDAVAEILRLKRREESKGLILIAANIAQMQPFLTRLSDAEMEQLEQGWPGPRTFLVPHNGLAPEWIRGRFDSVALRVTDHPLVCRLCEAFGGPIVSTSANPAGLREAKSLLDIRRYFGGESIHVLPGKLGGRNRPSEIRDLRHNRLIRSSQ